MSLYLHTKIKNAKKEAMALLCNLEIDNVPINLKSVAKKLNLQIEKIHFSNEQISGVLKINTNAGVPVIAVNTSQSETRQRFTIAHEIGHYILHNIQDLHVDSNRVYFRNERSSHASNIEEIQANQFAAELLMPTHLLIDDLAKISNLSEENLIEYSEKLSKKYKVSSQSMLIKISHILG